MVKNNSPPDSNSDKYLPFSVITSMYQALVPACTIAKRPNQGCQVLVTEKCRTLFKTGKILDYTIETSIDLKKANCLINSIFKKMRSTDIEKMPNLLLMTSKRSTWQPWSRYVCGGGCELRIEKQSGPHLELPHNCLGYCLGFPFLEFLRKVFPRTNYSKEKNAKILFWVKEKLFNLQTN